MDVAISMAAGPCPSSRENFTWQGAEQLPGYSTIINSSIY
jgi:hypothetical protein